MPSVGKNIPHDSAIGHVTGQAVYVDDIPPARDELFVDFVGSPAAHGQIESIDTTAARAIPGVVAIYTHADVSGDNLIGPVIHDEELLASSEVHHVGQPVIAIAADTREVLEQAKKLVKITIKEQPAIFSIEQAIAQQSFLGPKRLIERGDAPAALASAPHRLAGTLHIGGQDHFYLESHAAIAYPGEGRSVTVNSSTQNPTETQAIVAKVLGVGMHEVVSICKRMGGGFGGKETQGAGPAAMVAIVATKLRRPARIVFTKDDDMKTTGKRHPYRCDWQVGFDADGRITALVADFFSNGGFSVDLSLAVMERTMLHVDNAYYLPNARISGIPCRTNLPSNTAFRGFGGPQGVAAIENIMEEIAAYLGIDALDVRRTNLYGDAPRNITPYGQIVDLNHLPEIFDKIESTSNYRNRRAEITKYNRISRTELRGLSATAVKFGISFTKKFLNQGNALVNVYTDGTVQVSTGGTEMGQELNTKIRQLVADCFAIDVDRVLMMPTSTEKNNNTSPTAASAGTDLNGFAAVRACDQIKSRLTTFAAELLVKTDPGRPPAPEHIVFADGHVHDARQPGKRIAFHELTKLAHMERVDLGARGFYATPGVDFDRETGQGTPFLYYTTGAAVAEVRIDRFTGMMRIARLDLLMDIGRPINPGVDRGQVVGGFVQGIGWCTTEALIYDDLGRLLSYSPTTYKIPGVMDIPGDFRVDFLDNPDNTRNIAASKAVGEPPLLLGLCVWTAVKDALKYVQPGEIPPLNLPATGEEILLRITDLSAPPATSSAPASNAALQPVARNPQ